MILKGSVKLPISVFLELVEIKAKTASVFPFILGACYSWYNYHSLHPFLLIAFFIAMFFFNMAVDILDNYNDYHHAIDKKNYRRKTNIIGREHLSLSLVRNLMVSFIVISALIGIMITFFAGLPVLFIGILCFLVGIFYSSGPHPFSQLPVGEIVSGPTMGFLITLLCIYINTYQKFSFNLSGMLKIILISLPDTLWISNLMLANNICDLKEDVNNNRFTLVYYLGQKNSVYLFVFNNVLAIISLVVAFFVNIVPWAVLLSLAVLPEIIVKVKKFAKKQVKKETFVYAIQILAFGSAAQALTYLIYVLVIS